MAKKRVNKTGNGTTYQLRKELQRAGFKKEAIDAAWPSWWSDDMSTSTSASTELRLVIARNLGLSARSLLGERAEFVWRGEARFKHLSANNEAESRIIASFACASANAILQALPEKAPVSLPNLTAFELRATLLKTSQFVDLSALVIFCWSVGIPVVQLRITPIQQKRMHAMVAMYGGRHVVMLARETNSPSVTAFTLGHELGHIFLGHLKEARMIVDAKNSIEVGSDDNEEKMADQFAQQLLMGNAAGAITFDDRPYNAPGLATAAQNATENSHIHPGIVVLAFAHQQGDWARGMSALKLIEQPSGTSPIWQTINRLAAHELDLSLPNGDTADFLVNLLDLEHV